MQNKPNIFLRKAKEEDIETLVILRKLLLNEGTGHYVSKNENDQLAWQNSYRVWLAENLLDNENVVVLVVLYEEALVGCAIGIIDARVPFNGCLNGRMGWVQTVVVNPTHRRMGLAEKMMHWLFDWFKQNDVHKITLQTTPIAKSLYEKIGFVDSGEELLLKKL